MLTVRSTKNNGRVQERIRLMREQGQSTKEAIHAGPDKTKHSLTSKRRYSLNNRTRVPITPESGNNNRRCIDFYPEGYLRIYLQGREEKIERSKPSSRELRKRNAKHCRMKEQF